MSLVPWPKEIYCSISPALSHSPHHVYRTTDFGGPGTYPNWYPADDGLPGPPDSGNHVHSMVYLDPFSPSYRQYVIVGSNRTNIAYTSNLYRKIGDGSWELLLGQQELNDLLHWEQYHGRSVTNLCFDPLIPGRALIGIRKPSTTTTLGNYVALTEDYGDSWVAYPSSFYTHFTRGLGSVALGGDYIYARNSYVVKLLHRFSGDWIPIQDWDTGLWFNPYSPEGYYGKNTSSGGVAFYHHDGLENKRVIQETGSILDGELWCDPDNPLHMMTPRAWSGGGELLQTYDGFETFSSHVNLRMKMICPYVHADKRMIAVAEYDRVYTFYDDESQDVSSTIRGTGATALPTGSWNFHLSWVTGIREVKTYGVCFE